MRSLSLARSPRSLFPLVLVSPVRGRVRILCRFVGMVFVAVLVVLVLGFVPKPVIGESPAFRIRLISGVRWLLRFLNFLCGAAGGGGRVLGLVWFAC